MLNNYYPQNNQQYAPIQNGLVSVRNEMEARSYPIAYGNSVMFKDETLPYIYVKTMGFSQLEQPKFEKFKLVKEEPEEEIKVAYAEQTEVDALRKELEALKESLEKKVKKSE